MATRQFNVEGMTCEHCEASVREEISAIDGVTDVTADHATGLVEVTGEGFSGEQVAKAVSEAGYTLA